MTSSRFRSAHQKRSRAITRAIGDLAELGPPDELWSLMAETDPAGFLRAVADHIRALRAAAVQPPPTTNDPLPTERTA